MRVWPAIFVPPLLFLALLSGGLALVPWACAHETRAPLHWVSAVVLAIAAATVALAWRQWRETGRVNPDDRADRASWLRLLCVVGISVGAFFALATAALWLTQFVLTPCVR